MYDYDGLSRTVLAERREPYAHDPDNLCSNPFTGDRFVSTYTYGPMGVINRYEENNNSNPGDDKILWYLSDAMGGHVHVLVDRPLPDPDQERPPPIVNTLNTDAFGVRLSPDSGRTGMFGWRGREGSVTDRGSNLVYMQNRHYDPSLGRFIQADTVLVASMTTQGMNRYIYTENDPVNMSDPTGRNPLTAGLLLVVGLGILAGLINKSIGGSFIAGFWGGAITGAFGLLGGSWAILGVVLGIGVGSFLDGDPPSVIATKMAMGCFLGVVGEAIAFSIGGALGWLGAQLFWYIVNVWSAPRKLTQFL